MPTHSSILLIEDSPGECELFRQALAKSRLDVALYVEHDAEAALHFLKAQQGLPSLTLLDWHLRNRHGDTFLKQLRSQARFTAIPVVIFTTSDDASDLNAAYAIGANGYVVKPGTFDELVQCVHDLCRYWIDLNRTPYWVGATC
jgi:two-component system, chemotaxis family, response regulator Rcp1